MINVVFKYNKHTILIQCNLSELITDICERFTIKAYLDLKKLIFIYGGTKIDFSQKLSLKQLANQIDQNRNEMSVLVYDIDNMENKKAQLQYDFIETLKEKLQSILKLYLEDRNYSENKVNKWRDAIMRDCEKILASYRDFKIFINSIIYYDASKECECDWNYVTNIGKKDSYFIVNYRSNNINANLYVCMFLKNRDRTKKDIRGLIDVIGKEFLLLAEERSYEIFKKKYYNILEQKVIDEILKDYKYSLIYYYEIYNKCHQRTSAILTINQDKNDYFIHKTIETNDSRFYIALGKAN